MMNNFSLILIFLLVVAGAPQAPYLDFSHAGAGFYGSGREIPEPTDLTSVRIGVLGPEKSSEGRQMRAAIQMAIDEANTRGGYSLKVQPPSASPTGEKSPYCEAARKIPYEMVFRPDDGPWGAATSQVVKFAYEDNVWTIIGGLDGQRTHIAELVVTKAWVPVISPGTTDSTVDYANVPWVFRAVPADNRQADALLAFAKRQGYTRLVVLSEIEREAYASFKRLSESARHERTTFTLHLDYPPENPMSVIPQLQGISFDAAVIWGRAETAVTLIEGLRRVGIHVPVLVCSALATPEVAKNQAALGNLIVVAPYDLSRHDTELDNFQRHFESQTGIQAGPLAAYSYDVTRLVITAIDKAGLNRALIRDELAGTKFTGLTGPYRFSRLGGNETAPVLMTLKENGWCRIQ
jgi:branched-chain amino acid transport system substrate-binding protein